MVISAGLCAAGLFPAINYVVVFNSAGDLRNNYVITLCTSTHIAWAWRTPVYRYACLLFRKWGSSCLLCLNGSYAPEFIDVVR